MLSKTPAIKPFAHCQTPAERQHRSHPLQLASTRNVHMARCRRANLINHGHAKPERKPARFSTIIRQAQKQTFSSFDDMVQNSELPVLVDFSATWCGPCHMMSQILSTLSKKMADKLKVVKIDVDKYPKIAARYGIEALPTLVVFKDGQQKDRIEGDAIGPVLLNGQHLEERLQYLLFQHAPK